MMKKMLVLALVLGMASLASAGMQIVPGLEYEVDLTTNTLTITGTGVTGYLFNVMPDAGVLSGGDVPAAVFATVNEDGLWAGDFGENGWAGASASTTTGGKNGTIFTINFEAGTKTISFYESAFMGASSVDFADGSSASLNDIAMVVPEPMTMALLGLGGLFLRRRK